jgi:hypothetical protein
MASSTITGYATPIPPEPVPHEAALRLARLRKLSWVLDRSIPVGKWRVGLDPILGLMPGAGDWIGALLSFYVMYEGSRLGMPGGVLVKMAGNILVETLIGAVPVLGDVFDFVWQANTRNMALIEQNYHPELRGRPMRHVGLALFLFLALVLALMAGLLFLVFKALQTGFHW